MSDGRLHVDVTHLFDRPYRPTGLARIIAELARAARETSRRATAWRYDSALGSFQEVKWPEVEKTTGLPIADICPVRRSPGRALRMSVRRLVQKNRGLRVLHRLLHRSLMRVTGRNGLPAFSRNDLFVFADILDDERKLDAYRSLVEGSGVQLLFYCHDVIPLKFRAFVTDKLHDEFRRMIGIFSGPRVTTICNSEATSRDLRSARAELGLESKTPVVVSPGCDMEAARGQDGMRRMDAIAEPYILYVSTIEIRKNHKLLLEAWERMGRDGSVDPPLLVLVGQRGWLVDDLLKEIDERHGAAARVRLLTHVEDGDLARLYEDALFTVYPSLYEGWGIPVGESLYHGTFCLCSDRGALPEAGGPFVDYLDPEDAELWAARICHYLDHPEELRERERRIRESFVPRRWSDFRTEAKIVLRKALEEEPS